MAKFFPGAAFYKALGQDGMLGHTAVESHKEWCNKLRPAPRPLRLMCRGVNSIALGAWTADMKTSGMPFLGLTTRLSCSAAYLGKSHLAAVDAERLSAVLSRLKPIRLLLLVNNCCTPPIDDKHPELGFPTLFDVEVCACRDWDAV